MKYKKMTKKILSLLLCASMFLQITSYAAPVFASEIVDTETEPSALVAELEAHVGDQAVFDWWGSFTIAADTDSKPGEESTVSYDNLYVSELVVIIEDSYYDAENGYYWYKVAARDGETLPDPLSANPWVLYTSDSDIEDGCDPYLYIYDADEVIRFVTSNTDNLQNYYVLSGPAELEKANIEITYRDENYPVSELAYAELVYGTTFSKAFDITITKKENGEAWSASDGLVAVRYEAAQFGSDTYTEDIECGGGFVYVDGKMYSAAPTDRWGYEISDVVYTNSGFSTLVFEHMPASMAYVGSTAYFANETTTLYDNQFNGKEFTKEQLPAEFTASYFFTYNEEEYYWLESDAFIGSPYFIVNALDVTSEKPEVDPDEPQDPQEPVLEGVAVTDKDGNAVESISLPIYEKVEITAASSMTGDVNYQWQIQYDTDAEGNALWVDIYGEDSKTCKLSFAMIGTILADIGFANVRCKAESALGTEYSAVIPVNVEFYEPEEPDVEVSESIVTSNGETVTVSVSGNIPNDSSVALEETDSEGVDVASGETVVASFDISIKNADGTEWQPESGETVTVSLDASKIGLKNGDAFVIYHLHNGEVKLLGTYVVENDTVTFKVDGFSKFVFALAAEENNFDECLGLYATFNAYNEWIGEGSFDYFWLRSDVTDEEMFEWSIYDDDFAIDQVVQIADYYVDSENSLWFRVEPVNGLELPASLQAHPWVHMNNVDQYDSEYDALCLFEPEDISGEDLVVLDEYGLPVSEVYMYSDEKKTVTAQTALTGSVEYQWQVCYDLDNFLWMDITGQDSESLNLSYALVSGVLSEDGWAAVRCVTSNAVETVEGMPLIVYMLESYEEEPELFTFSLFPDGNTARFASPAMLASNGVSLVAEEPSSSTVLVTVQFVMGDNTAPIENGLKTHEVPYNGTVTQNITIPTVEGYAAYLENDRTTPLTGFYQLNLTNVTEPQTITIRYWPAEVEYKVVYMQQNIDNDDYTVVKTNNLTGLTGSDPVVEEIDYNGFVQVWCDTDVIAADGSTVVEVKYDRLYYKMLFDLDGGYGVQPVYARYGTPVSVINPTKAGYVFMGWNALNGPKSDGDDTTVDIPVFTDIEIPAMNTNYKALWQASDIAKVTVNVWGQNADDDGYSYMLEESANLSFMAKPGTKVTYNPDGGYVCGLEAHTHGTDCNATCGKEEHEHSIADGCYKRICGLDEHTTHTEACYTCGGLTSGHDISHYSVGNGCDISDTAAGGNVRWFINNYIPSPNTTGGLYRIDGWGSDSYYFKLGNDYYQVTGNVGNNTSVTKTCECHTEHNDSCELTCTVHQHSDECYELTCTKPVHAHTASCYDCGKMEHQHGGGCELTINTMKSNLWTFSHADTVTVAADGSTTLNVYFDRTEKTLTYKYRYKNGNYQSTESITAKWGADISDKYVKIADNAGSTFWSATSDGEDPYTNYFGVMPENSATYYNRGALGSEGEMTYYGQSLTGEYVKMFSVSGVGGYSVSDEDRYEFEGFTYHHGTGNHEDCEGAKFYYTRNSYNLVFNNYGENERTESVLYEAPLSAYGSYALDSSEAPAVYEPGSVKFKGWYLAPQTPNDFNFENATPFDFTKATMPATDMILYAWWEPVNHAVTFYYDYNALEKGEIYNVEGTQQILNVPHGSKIQDPYIPPKDPSSQYYSFVGWAYRDDNGTEILWDFENSTVTEDVQLYGKWQSTTPAKYEVKFVTVKDGEEVEIAAPITGSALGGTLKTFNAKVNDDLYEGYQDRYYPRVMSHSITINVEDESKNTFTFYYDYEGYTSYTVKYLEEGTDKPMSEINSSYPAEKTITNNTHSMVTETFVPIAGYLPDAYQKVCYIDPNGTNEIIFYYKQDNENGLWVVHYYLEDLENDAEGNKTYTENVDMLFTGTASNGATVTAPTNKEIPGYYYYAEHEGNVSTGTISTENVTHLHMYYNRTVHGYTVRYVESGTQKVLADEIKRTPVKWGTVVTEKAIDIEDYQVYGDDQKQLEISVLEESNVITFYYVEKQVNIHYVAENGGSVNNASETLKVKSGNAVGSTAAAEDGYTFLGWYNEEGERVSGNSEFVPAKVGDKNVAATYYAKFELDVADLKITKALADGTTEDRNQAFVFEVKKDNELIQTVVIYGSGSVTIKDLPIAEYTVTELTDWSWRYNLQKINGEAIVNGTNSKDITISANSSNTVTFTNALDTDSSWLGSESYAKNIFTKTDNGVNVEDVANPAGNN